MKTSKYQPNDASNGIICNVYPELDLHDKINAKGLMYAQISAYKSTQPWIYFHLVEKYRTRNDKGEIKHLGRRLRAWKESPDTPMIKRNHFPIVGESRGRMSSGNVGTAQQLAKIDNLMKTPMTPPEGGYAFSIIDIGEGENGGQEMRIMLFKNQLADLKLEDKEMYKAMAKKFMHKN